MDVTKSSKAYSCALCRRRKVRCDQGKPCSYCVKHRMQCIPAEQALPRQRRKRFPEAELLARIGRYETALKSYGADLDKINSNNSVNSAGGASDSFPGDSNKYPSTEYGSLASGGEAVNEDTFWQSSKDEFEEANEMLQGSSGDEIGQGPIITTTYDTLFDGDGDGLLFNAAQQGLDLSSIHPQPIQIFSLWQVFIENVNPLTKMFHAPTVQQQILKASATLKTTSNAMHAMMFGIYALATKTLEDDDCLATYHEDKQSLMLRYQFGAQQALQNASFLRSADLTVLQALVLYLHSIIHHVDPRALFCLTAIADRIARKHGLQYDHPVRGLSLFQMEMRKRLWWQIVFLESRISETSGAGPALLSPMSNTKLPLNINDSDLNLGMSSIPTEHAGATDMIFCLIRCEVGEFLRKLRLQRGIDAGWQEFSNPLIPFVEKDRLINEFEARLEERYLRYCDTQVPLHIMARYVTKFSIGKMRVTAHRLWLRADRTSTATSEAKDYVFEICLEMLENHIAVRSNKKVKNFNWYLNMNLPVVALLYVLPTLRERTAGPLADRAWTVLPQVMDFLVKPRGMPAGRGANGSALQVAYTNLLIKAWEARKVALWQTTAVSTPPLIVQLSENMAAKKNHSSSSKEVVATSTSGLEPNLYGADPSLSTPITSLATQMNPSLAMDAQVGPQGSMIPIIPEPLSFDDGGTMDLDYWNDLLPGYTMQEDGFMENIFQDNQAFSIYH